MKTSVPSFFVPASLADATPARWQLSVAADPEPLLLPRLLQKLAVPEVALQGVRFDAGGPASPARAELVFAAAAVRATLVTARVRRLMPVRSAFLTSAA